MAYGDTRSPGWPRVEVLDAEDKAGATIAASVKRLLSVTSPAAAAGVECILIRRVTDLRRMERRRHDRIVDDRILATYFPRFKSTPPRIDLYSDSISESAHGHYLRFPFFRDVLVGWVLFHEVGHHISTEIHPRRGDSEKLAEESRKKLFREAMARMYPVLFPSVRVARKLFGRGRRPESRA